MVMVCVDGGKMETFMDLQIPSTGYKKKKPFSGFCHAGYRNGTIFMTIDIGYPQSVTKTRKFIERKISGRICIL